MSLADQTGNPAVGAQLQRGLQRGRLAHAYLFAGPRGAGKEAMARALAATLNCLDREHDSCGQCLSCRQIAADKHPDVYWVKPESKSRRIQIEQVREFERAVCLKASTARVKVGVIADADCMTESAQNAFLKTLEEPPPRTIIVLLTAEPQRLLPTIISRCLRVSFGRTSEEASPFRAKVVPLLVEFAAAKPVGVVQVYRLHAALTALLAELREQVRQRIENEDQGQYGELDPKAQEKLDEQRAARIEGEYRGAREQVLEELYTWFSDLLLCVEGADAKLLAHPDRQEDLAKAAAGLSYARATAHLDAIEHVRDALSRNIAEPFALEVGLLKLLG